MWLSADPALGRYLQAGGKATSEGVFNSKNLGLYTYCFQNPVILIDPDGREPSVGAWISAGVAFSSGVASYKLAGGSHASWAGAAISGAFSGAVAWAVTAIDFSDGTVFAANAIGAMVGNTIAQMYDIFHGTKEDFSYGGLIGAIIGGGFFGSAAYGIGSAAEKAFAESLGDVGGKILGETIGMEVFGISGIFAETIGEGVGNSYDFGKGLNFNIKMPNLNNLLPETNGIKPVPFNDIIPADYYKNSER